MSTTAKGTVARLYPSGAGTYIKLNGLPPADTPKNGLFFLELRHANYNALYSLALAAAVNRLELMIRIDGDDIDPAGDYPTVSYMVVDW